MKSIIFIVLSALLSACSTVQTVSGSVPLASLQHSSERFQLRVNTGDQRMDQIVYEFAFQQFSQVLPLAEREPYTGTLDITFSSQSEGAFVGTSNTVGSVHTSNSGWFIGNGYTGQGYATGSSSTVTTGTVFEWQNSTMLAVLRHSDGDRLWSADYDYRGGWEMSGFVVNTPEQAARLVTQRLRERFTQDVRH